MPSHLPDYLADVAREMRQRSTSIRRDFASHRLSSGENKEELVSQFLQSHLPSRFGVRSGIVISHDGALSNQADLLVVDRMNNAPLYGGTRHELWPAEAVYALLEVKSSLTPSELSDAVAKGRRFKRLARRFCSAGANQRLADSLFIVWGFESASPEAFKASLLDAVADVPVGEQPDLVVVPDKLVARSGQYLQMSVLGQPGSPHRRALEATHGPDLSTLLPQPADVWHMGENALLGWYLWTDSWLRQAGARLTDPVAYLPPDRVFGHAI